MQRPLLLSALDRRLLVFDGAMGTSVHACADCVRGDWLGRENCTDVLTRSRPDLIQRVHESFLAVGADVVETNTFGANEVVAAEFDSELVDWVADLNRDAARLARAACQRYTTPDRPRFVAGSMGPGTKLVSLGQVPWEPLLASYRAQASALLEGGVDCFIIETCQDLLQVKCAVNACLEALERAGRSPHDVPIMVSITMETTGTMLLGSDMPAVCTALAPFPIASLGLNCATGPVEMVPHIAHLARHWPGRISVIPNAGLPVLVEGRTEYPLQAAAFADSMRRFVAEFQVDAVGGCCGTTPAHIAGLAGMAQARPAARRSIEPAAPSCGSLYSAVELRQDKSFLIIAERTNANGSRKFKRLLEEGDFEGIVGMAREEMRDGSHLIDLCVDFVGRDGAADMGEVVSRLVRQLDAPLMIDSTSAEAIEAGLKRAGGRCIVNSINLEDGEARMERVCPLLQRFGAACVALTIDEDPQAGMAKTAARKLAIAERIHDLYTRKWGLDETGLLFDPLTFTIATGNADDRRLGLETLEGIRLISERFPACGVILGLSNISFGLKPAARAVLNSVFLHEARQRGLTGAIVHASKILPQDRIDPTHWDAAQWLIFDRRGEGRPAGQPESFDPLLHFISLFPDGESASRSAHAPLAELPLEARLRAHIIEGDPTDLSATLEEALSVHGPLEIINDHLLDGMRQVGDLFGSGRMQLPFVLQSAAVMKQAVAFLQPYMARSGIAEKPRGRIVLATVAGDVHDIGKNLVDIILSNNGFAVHNIGIKQPLAAMLDAWRSTGADAIGMSGLLVKSVGVMEENLREIRMQGITVPVLLGGAALTRAYAEGHLREVSQGRTYYGRDAFEGLALCEAIADGRLREVDAQIASRSAKRQAVEGRIEAMRIRSATAPALGDDAAGGSDAEVGATATTVHRLSNVPQPPFWGHRLAEHIPLEQIYPFVNPVALFRGQWGFKKGAMSDADYQRQLTDTVEPIFERLKQLCSAERILRPSVVWGYFPCASEGNDLRVFDPQDHEREIERFSFPRQRGRQLLCISDYFLPSDAANRDVVAFHCVTMGPEASHRARALFERHEYAEYLYLHGMGVECAEALAELWHKRIRAELGIGGDDDPSIRRLFTQKYRGSRYSFGYPACPEMADQAKLFRLLNPERIGCTLTENFQIDPEQSTSAIVVHHPEAKYFAI